jgi:hypothetical protein
METITRITYIKFGEDFVIDCQNNNELLDVLKKIHQDDNVDHVHLEFGYYNQIGMWQYKGEVIIPFKEGITPYIYI